MFFARSKKRSFRFCVFSSKKHPAKKNDKKREVRLFKGKKVILFQNMLKIGCKKRELNYLLRGKKAMWFNNFRVTTFRVRFFTTSTK